MTRLLERAGIYLELVHEYDETQSLLFGPLSCVTYDCLKTIEAIFLDEFDKGRIATFCIESRKIIYKNNKEEIYEKTKEIYFKSTRGELSKEQFMQ